MRRSRRLGFPWGRLPNGQRRTRSRRRPRARSHGREGRAAARPRCASTRPGRSTSAARPARTVRCAIARSSRRTCRWSASSLAGAPATMVSRSIHSSCRVRPSVRRRKPRRSSTAVDLAPSRTSALTNRSTGVSFSCRPWGSSSCAAVRRWPAAGVALMRTARDRRHLRSVGRMLQGLYVASAAIPRRGLRRSDPQAVGRRGGPRRHRPI